MMNITLQAIIQLESNKFKLVWFQVKFLSFKKNGKYK